MLAYCGLDCEKCQAYIATYYNDDQMRKRIALEWSERFGRKFDYKEINCNGCRPVGKKIAHCLECRIRKCAQTMQLTSCAQCKEFPCKKLNNIFSDNPEAKETLYKVNEWEKTPVEPVKL
jgi:hypothetical protein